MDETREDFWPSPSSFATLTDDPAPAVLLKRQASLLREKTCGLVEGVVEVNTVQGKLYYSLYLNAPRLDDYMFKILDVVVPVTSLGDDPGAFSAQDTFGNSEATFTSMDEFTAWLRATLSSDLVAGVIGNLMKQSRIVVDH